MISRGIAPRLLLAGAVLGAAAVASGSQLDDVVRLWKAAIGGKKIEALRGVRMKGMIAFGSDAGRPFTVEVERPGKIRTEIRFAEGTYLQIFDGRRGWIALPFGPTAGVRPMTAEELANAPEQADIEGPLVDSAAKGIKLALEGKEKVDGRDAWRIRVTRPDGVSRWLDLDVATSLKVRWEGELGQGAEKKMNVSTFSDHRPVDGITFPFRIVSGILGETPGQTIALESIEVNPKIDPADFAQPH